MAESTTTRVPAPTPVPPTADLSADVASVRRLVQRTGCTIREATLQLEGKPVAEQREIAAHGKADPKPARKARLVEALKQLEVAGIMHDAPCPFGAPKKGPAPTWGDVVARLVLAGQAGDVATIIARAKARGAA